MKKKLLFFKKAIDNFWFWSLFLLFLLSLFLRIYRLGDLLGFYYDQGRDALRVWEFWYNKKPFLVGPVTGLEGIFLGPFYYYLIAPFYLVGGGNPVYPAIFISFLSSLSVFFIFYLGWKFHSKAGGIIAAIIFAFSYNLVLASRWLSNPTPILLSSTLLMIFFYKIYKTKNKKWWYAISVLVGLSMQFESASAVFYIPISLIFYVWLATFEKKADLKPSGKLHHKKILFISAFLFFLTLIPQIIFNFRHDNLLLNNFLSIFFKGEKGGGFGLNFKQILPIRLKYFWEVYYTKLIPNESKLVAIFTLISFFGLYLSRKTITKKFAIPFLLIFLLTPMAGFILFQGNYGNIYDYYMTGYYLPFVLFFSLGLAEIWQKRLLGKALVFLFFMSFFAVNIPLVKNYLSAGIDGKHHITLGNQIQAVEYVIKDAGGKKFNVDFYVPPVLPYSYDYLFLWRTSKMCDKNRCGFVKDERVELLYTPYEVDPLYPDRLESWLKRQDSIGRFLEEKRFGGITVQKRKRILY